MASRIRSIGGVASFVSFLAITACGTPGTPAGGAKPDSGAAASSPAPGSAEQVALGRYLVVSHACGDCHGGGANPAAPFWLDGMRDTLLQQFRLGPMVIRPRNITPDNTTGIGRFSERQIFNALRYGLRPGDTPDVEITSNVPGQGNFPAVPHYLSPVMPWPSWRHMKDEELMAIAAYLKRGVKPSNHKVQDSDGPPDFWASFVADSMIGPLKTPAFPTANEVGGAEVKK